MSNQNNEPYARFAIMHDDDVEFLEFQDDIYSIESAEAAGAEYNPLIDALVESIAAGDDFNLYLEYIKMIESGYWDGSSGEVEGGYHMPLMNYDAFNEITDAAGLYQFTPDTIDSARIRAENLGFTKELTDTIQGDPRDMPEHLQSIIFIANILNRGIGENESTYFGKKGRDGLVDELAIKAFIDNDMDAMNDIYYTLHHTMLYNPKTGKYDRVPEETKNLVESINLGPLAESWDKSDAKENLLNYYSQFIDEYEKHKSLEENGESKP